MDRPCGGPGGGAAGDARVRASCRRRRSSRSRGGGRGGVGVAVLAGGSFRRLCRRLITTAAGDGTSVFSWWGACARARAVGENRPKKAPVRGNCVELAFCGSAGISGPAVAVLMHDRAGCPALLRRECCDANCGAPQRCETMLG